jgi:hypothetical protein
MQPFGIAAKTKNVSTPIGVSSPAVYDSAARELPFAPRGLRS